MSEPGEPVRAARLLRVWRAPTAALLLAAAPLAQSTAQSQAQTQEPAAGAVALPELFGAFARERLGDPELHARYGEHLGDDRFARLLSDLHLQFKAQQAADDDGHALGFAFDFAKSRVVSSDPSEQRVELVASGNVAFDQDTNPDDLVSAQLRMRWAWAQSLGPGAPRAEQLQKLRDPHPEDLAALDATRFAALSSRYANELSAERVRADPDFQALARRYVEGLEHELPAEVLWDSEMHAGMESNQDFSSRQVVFGGSLGARLVSWEDDTPLSRMNAFDLPGAALRWLAGQDEGFHPSGQAWPNVVLGLDVVDAARDETRGALTDDESFLRARFEAGLKSHVLDLEDEALYLSLGWRTYQEIDAPGEVRRADTDRADHIEVSLDLPRGWELSYTAGELPLDSHYDSSFALGFEIEL